MATKVTSTGQTTYVAEVAATGQTTFVKKITIGTPIRSIVESTSSLAGLNDTTFTNLENFDLLNYDSASGKWVNTDSATLNSLTLKSGGRIRSSLIPYVDSALDLGSADLKWKDLHLSGGTIFLGGLSLKDIGDQFSVQDSQGQVLPLDISGSTSAIRALFSGGGDISYDANTGVISVDVELSYTSSNFDSDLDAAISGGTGLSYDSATNTISILNTGVSASSYGSATEIPVLTVNAQGQITTVTTTTVAGVTSVNFDSTNGTFTVNTADGSSFSDVITLDPFTTSNLAEGNNLYYTTARSDSDFDARFDSSFDERLATKTTSDISEGTNLYYTTTRTDSDAKAALFGGNGVTYDSSSGIISIGQPVGLQDSVNFGHVVADSATFNNVLLHYNNKINLGTDNELEIFHDGNDGRIENDNSGDLIISSISTKLKSDTGELLATFNKDSNVSLYYNNELKLETDAAGVNIFNELDVDSVRASGITTNTLDVTGRLTVTGTQTILNTQTLSVNDPLLHLADSNVADALDIGFIGLFYKDGDFRHTGLFRDADNSQYYLFDNLIDSTLDSEPGNNAIDRTIPSFRLSTLNVGTLIGSVAGFDSDFSQKTTDDLSEGDNLQRQYYRQTRVDSAIDARVTGAYVNALSGLLIDSTELPQTFTVTGDITANNITGNGDIEVVGDFRGKGNLLVGPKGPAFLDSSSAQKIIIQDVTTSFVNSLNVDANSLNGGDSSYFLNASNINAGTISDDRLPATITSNITGNAASADSATNATNAIFADSSSLAALAVRASQADSATNATNAIYADSASLAALAVRASQADSATNATNAIYADSAALTALAVRASQADSADNATNSIYADSASLAALAVRASQADSADNATQAIYADSASLAALAVRASQADSADNATQAIYADSASLAALAVRAQQADSATNAGSAVQAENADRLDNQQGSHYLDYNNFTNTPTIPTLYVNFVDSTQVSSIITSTDFVDSTDVSNIITADVDAAFINALTIDADTLGGQNSAYHLNFNNLTNKPTILDSSNVSSIITNDVDASFINALNIDADTLGGQNGAYYLNYNNFTNTPTIPKLYTNFVDSAQVSLIVAASPAIPKLYVDFVDSDIVTGLIDSAYVVARAGTGTDSATVSSIIIEDVDANFINALTIGADSLGGQAPSHYLDYNNFTNTPSIPTLYADFVDSGIVTGLIDSAYVVARAGTGTDSATVSAIIINDVDANFINALTIGADSLGGQAPSHYLDYNNFTNTPTIPTLYTDFVDSTQVTNIINSTDLVDSTDVSNIITSDVDANFINALTIGADSLGGQAPSYYLNYNNLNNKPTILDSSQVQTVSRNGLVASDAGGDGSFTYDSSTGNFTYTGPSASEVRAHFSNGTGVTITDGSVAIGQSVGTSDDVTFAKITGDSASLGQVSFRTNFADSHIGFEEGALWYDPLHKNLNYYTDFDHPIEIGMQMIERVYNNTGAQIDKGKPLYYSGNRINEDGKESPTVGLANATSATKYNVQGLAAENIPDNSYGQIVVAGVIDGFDTSGLNAGDNFFVGLTDGAVQNAPPVYPNFPMCLGWVIKSDATEGKVIINQQNHSVSTFRVQTDAHIGATLIVDGDLTVNGTQTITSTENVSIGGNIQYLNAGNTIGEAGTTFVGSGLDDAFYAGHYQGDSSTKAFFVKIDATGTPDTFEWGHDSTVGTVATGIAITGAEQILDSEYGISIDFGATTGHTLNDKWTGTATALNVDTGLFSNKNEGDAGNGYTNVGLYWDASQNEWTFVSQYDSDPVAPINRSGPTFAYGDVRGKDFYGTSFNGALTGNASTSTVATNVNATANNSTDESTFVTFVDGATGTQGIETDTSLVYNPSSNTMFFGGTTDGTAISQGSLVLKNAGTASYIDFYCESSNAHYTRIQSAAHSEYTGNITLTLPTTTGTVALLSDVTDSVATINLINSTVDSAYVALREANNLSVITDFKDFVYTPSTATATFQDSDDNGNTLTYTVGKINVFFNGAKLADTTDYTATNGTSVSLNGVFADSGDTVIISTIGVANQIDLAINTADSDLTTTNANQVVDTFEKATYRSAKYFVQFSHPSDSKFHTTEVLLVHNGSAVTMTQYGDVKTDSSLGTIDADISGSNVRLLVTPSFTNTNVDVRRIHIPV